MLGSMVVLGLAFKGISIPSSIMAVSIYILTNSATVSLFSTPSPALIVCRLFDDGHFDRCEVVFPCGFDWHFFNNEQCLAPFHALVSDLYGFFLGFPGASDGTESAYNAGDLGSIPGLGRSSEGRE